MTKIKIFKVFDINTSKFVPIVKNDNRILSRRSGSRKPSVRRNRGRYSDSRLYALPSVTSSNDSSRRRWRHINWLRRRNETNVSALLEYCKLKRNAWKDLNAAEFTWRGGQSLLRRDCWKLVRSDLGLKVKKWHKEEVKPVELKKKSWLRRIIFRKPKSLRRFWAKRYSQQRHDFPGERCFRQPSRENARLKAERLRMTSNNRISRMGSGASMGRRSTKVSILRLPANQRAMRQITPNSYQSGGLVEERSAHFTCFA